MKTSTIPGWYEDPYGVSDLRYFDGGRWTSYVEEYDKKSKKDMTVKILITIILVSVVMLGYFLWNLYGDSVYTMFKQSEFRTQLAASPAKAPNTASLYKLPALGAPVGTIVIPAIALNVVFVAGTNGPQLAEGPGVMTSGVFPGLPGNATISGHRTTHTSPFYALGNLVKGDLIYINIPNAPQEVFQVRGIRAVNPNDVAVTSQTPGVRLTLTTCNPLYSATTRLIVQAEEIKGAYASKALPPSEWKFQD